MSDETDQRKLLSVLCHGSIFFGAIVVSVGIPIAIWLLSQDSIVKQNAKAALNFHINLWAYEVAFILLTVVLIGYPLLVVLGLVNLVMPIVAIVRVLGDPDRAFRYPFVFRVFH